MASLSWKDFQNPSINAVWSGLETEDKPVGVTIPALHESVLAVRQIVQPHLGSNFEDAPAAPEEVADERQFA